MATITRISDLPSCSALNVTDIFPMVQDFSTKKVDFSTLATFLDSYMNWINNNGNFGVYTLPYRFGSNYLWVDSLGKLRIKNSQPTGDTDGALVGS